MPSQSTKQYIPLDKSWIIRLGVLDLVHRRQSDSIKWLQNQASLGDDLRALLIALLSWDSSHTIDVGESGTLYRYLQFTSWKLAVNKLFLKHGTLRDRSITGDPSITKLTQNELIKLDHGSSQWASAAALNGDQARLKNPPYHLAMTYEAIDHWTMCRAKNQKWEPRLDRTIARQTNTFRLLLQGKNPKFEPEQAEDFCFAYALGYIELYEAKARWPSLHGHESDRIVEMSRVLKNARIGLPIGSVDHRVVQAIALWSRVHNQPVHIKNPDCVSKSWPAFWTYLDSVQ